MSPHDPDDEGDAHESAANGAGTPPSEPGDGDALDDAFTVAPPPPAILELVASCVRFVLAKYKVQLDGTPDTLGVLDHYVREARADLAARPEGLALVETTVGAYFGEVVRSMFDSSWHLDEDKAEWRLRMKHVYLTFNPVGMAREALTEDDAPGWHAHIEVDAAEEEEVQRRLAVLPEVPEDEYYAPSTRFDVIELTVVTLRARMRASGLRDIVFTDEDYEKA